MATLTALLLIFLLLEGAVGLGLVIAILHLRLRRERQVEESHQRIAEDRRRFLPP